MPRILLVITLILFALLTAVAVWQHGYFGIFTWHLQSSAGMQVLIDLVIALLLVMVWIWHDARACGRNPWPWLLATLALGSFGPLLYLLTRQPPASA